MSSRRTSISNKLTQRGTNLATTSSALESSMTTHFQATRDNASNPGQAVEHFKQWKSGVGQLHDVIDRQLKFCQELRSNHTLLSLYEDTESEAQRKYVNTLITQMKVDIRSVIKRYPSATAISLPAMNMDDLDEQMIQEQYEHKMQEQYEQKNKEGKSAPSSSTAATGRFHADAEEEAELDVLDDDPNQGMKRKIKIERSVREIHTRRVNVLLKSIVLPGTSL